MFRIYVRLRSKIDEELSPKGIRLLIDARLVDVRKHIHSQARHLDNLTAY